MDNILYLPKYGYAPCQFIGTVDANKLGSVLRAMDEYDRRHPIPWMGKGFYARELDLTARAVRMRAARDAKVSIVRCFRFTCWAKRHGLQLKHVKPV